MKNKLNILIITGLFLSIGLGCSAIKDVSKYADKTAEKKTVVSTDNKVQLKVPSTWTVSKRLNDQAILQVEQPLSELYTIVIPDDKSDFDDSVDLDFFTEQIRTNTKNAMGDATFSDPVSVKINGFDARQFEVDGTVDKLKVKYIFTLIDTPKSFYQVLSWTLTSRFDDQKSLLINAVNSFELVGDNVKSPPPPAKK